MPQPIDPAPINWPFPTWKGQPLPSKMESVTMKIKTNELNDATYNLAEGAARLTVKDFCIRIHSTHEGVIVDVWAKGREDEDLIASTYAFDSEAQELDAREAV